MENEVVLQQMYKQCVEQADMWRGVSMEVFLAISYASQAISHASCVLYSFQQNDGDDRGRVADSTQVKNGRPSPSRPSHC